MHDGVRRAYFQWKKLEKRVSVPWSFSTDKQSGKRLLASPRDEAADGRTPGGLALSDMVDTSERVVRRL